MRTTTEQAGLSALLVMAALPAQWTSSRPPAFPGIAYPVAAFEPVTGKGYLFGGGSSLWYEQDGAWMPSNFVGPSPGTVQAVCTLPGQGVLAIGGGQQWTWNGTSWSQWANVVPPTAYGIAFDPVRNVVVALNGTQYNLQTWEFGGTTWSLRSSAWPPGGPFVYEARLAWDPATQTVMAVAGANVGGMSAFLGHRWNGTAWTSGAVVNSIRSGFSLSSAPGGVVVSGGFEFPFYYGGTLRWNGTQWLPLANAGYARLRSVGFHDTALGRAVIASTGQGRGTWYWDGTTVTRPVVGDGPQQAAASCYDSWRGKVLQFGGRYGAFEDTAELCARDAEGRWQCAWQFAVVRRSGHACAFDDRRGRMVMIGGEIRDSGGGSVFLSDSATWEWDGSTWSSVAPPSTFDPTLYPYSRVGSAMAFDRQRGRTVLFGGTVPSGTILTPGVRTDTWEWDGVSWARRQPTTIPGPGGRMWYDAGLGRCVLQSDRRYVWTGSDWLPTPLPPIPGATDVFEAYDASHDTSLAVADNGTWLLVGGQWSQISPQPLSHLGTFDLGSGRFVGMDGFYWYDVGDTAAATIAPFGTGCTGSNGTPVLHGEDPFRVGVTRTVHLANLPTNAPYFAMLGSEADTWLGQSVPIELAPLGAPQCALRTEVAAYELRNGPDWPLAVPQSPTLAGLTFRLQAFVFDLGANALGATTSNALRLRIGG